MTTFVICNRPNKSWTWTSVEINEYPIEFATREQAEAVLAIISQLPEYAGQEWEIFS